MRPDRKADLCEKYSGVDIHCVHVKTSPMTGFFFIIFTTVGKGFYWVCLKGRRCVT